MSDLKLLFTLEDLQGYLTLRTTGLTHKSVVWLKKSVELLWNATKGVVSVTTLQSLRNHVLGKYTDLDAKRKVLQFARAFLGYMSKISFDQRYAAFDSKSIFMTKRSKEIDQIKSELAEFEIRIADSGRDTFNDRGEGHHSDLVIALALAVWAADFDGYAGGPVLW